MEASRGQSNSNMISPYKNKSVDLIYNLLFCDNLELYEANTENLDTYPCIILFSDSTSKNELVKIVSDSSVNTRLKILAYQRLADNGGKIHKQELLAVIVEVGLDNGLDVLATYIDGTARYINQTGKMIFWETTNKYSNELTKDLFQKSYDIVKQIGPWEKPRRPHPTKGNVRITFLVSDGLYFGEGPADILFNDPMAGPALMTAAKLVKYLTETSLGSDD